MNPAASARYQHRIAQTCIDCGNGSITHRCAKCLKAHKKRFAERNDDHQLNGALRAIIACRNCGQPARGLLCRVCRIEQGEREPAGSWLDTIPSLQTVGGQRALNFVSGLNRAAHVDLRATFSD